MGFAAGLRRGWLPTRPWDRPEDSPWRSATFCVVDVETTGLDLRRDEIVSIGAVKVREGRVTAETYYSLARPRGEMSAQSMAVHAILPDDVEAARPIEDVLAEFRVYADGAALVAHAAWVERAFINRALKSSGQRLPAAIIDTAALARHLGMEGTGGREPSLEFLARRLELPVHSPHHALGDAMTTAVVLLAVVSQLEAGGGVTLDDLYRLSAAAQR